MFLLNSLKQPDVIFFILIVCVLGFCVLLYFLMPVINRKKYAEQRANLKNREENFNKTRKTVDKKTEGSKVESTVDTACIMPENETNDNKEQ